MYHQKNIMKKIELKIKLLLLFVAGGVFSTQAQQDSQFTQYMYNTSVINPAYAGSRDMLSITGAYRAQWVGLNGAPQTNTLSMNTPVGDRTGLGITVVSDRIGPVSDTNFSTDFSYNIPVSPYARLYFGVKASASLVSVNYNKLDNEYPNDPRFQNSVEQFSPNVGAGVYLQEEKWYVGLSVPNFLKTSHFNEYKTSNLEEEFHGYLMGGYVFDLSREVQFKPAVLAKVAVGAPLQVDLSANFLFMEKLTLGVAYRWDAAVSGMAGFQVTPGLMAGYSYDFDTTKLGNYNSGSHEVFLRFDIFDGVKPIINARFF
ncbi:type IX secretion system membrane protein PorP/SprF [Flavobacterium sp. LAR06]|uniref:PorP/SprF family type IX secretion system membrane protein n=1 Tax=Flavobacterium sp. LAR06 TaxID=3064897 RepID=UPI0035C01A48